MAKLKTCHEIHPHSHRMRKSQDPVIPPLSIYSREMKIYARVDKAVVFIIVPNWKQPQMSLNWLTDKYIAADPFHGTLLSNKRNY